MQNFMKTIINGLQRWTEKKLNSIEEKLRNSVADWNENDSSKDSYIKNRTHWEEKIVKTISLSGTYNGTWNWITYDTTDLSSLWVEGKEVIVKWNGIQYNLTVRWDSAMGYNGIGNFSQYLPSAENTGEPFAIYVNGFGNTENFGIIIAAGSEETAVEATCEISFSGTVIHKLDSKYLDLDIDTKMDMDNPVGTGSFSMNRKVDTIIGDCSHAEGYYTTASDFCSHAEGNNTTASGANSHAEGDNTTASGADSHAEGYYTIASGDYSHAEGYTTTASNSYSHTEGYYTKASGTSSHAEGRQTTASGGNSHTEGYYTKASSNNQHVQGKFNIEDSSETYAHIVGNGTSNTARSNAHTLDWNGVGWFQGGLQVGGTAQDDGAQTVMLNGDKEIILASSTEGSTKKFKLTIDDNGVLTASEIETTT